MFFRDCLGPGAVDEAVKHLLEADYDIRVQSRDEKLRDMQKIGAKKGSLKRSVEGDALSLF